VTATATPIASCNQSCGTNSDCQNSLICSGGMCRLPSCINETDCVCPTTTVKALASCSQSCSSNGDCDSSYICSGGMCRNPSCVGESGCICTTVTASTQRTTTPTPVELPDAGITLPTLATLGGGLIMLLIGILLVL
jgi:hypothetical protein